MGGSGIYVCVMCVQVWCRSELREKSSKCLSALEQNELRQVNGWGRTEGGGSPVKAVWHFWGAQSLTEAGGSCPVRGGFQVCSILDYWMQALAGHTCQFWLLCRIGVKTNVFYYSLSSWSLVLSPVPVIPSCRPSLYLLCPGAGGW